MKLNFLILGLVLFGAGESNGSGDIRSSLTFVIDDTNSMRQEINAVKSQVNQIFDTVMNSHSSQIEDFVLLTFNDDDDDTKYDSKTPFYEEAFNLRAKTKDRSVFKQALDEIVVHGGGICPERSMAGIIKALQRSLEGSTLYVFTDASAKDYKMYREVEALSQKMGCQIVFLLTGDCNERTDEDYLVYDKIAYATDGEVFHLGKTETREVLKFVMHNIENRKQPLTRRTFPAGHGSFNVSVDGEMKELTITVSGKSPTVRVTDSGGTEKPTTDVGRTEESVMVKVTGVEPGVYTVEVRGNGETRVSVKASTSVHFQHGFSTFVPTVDTPTSRSPVPGVESHLSIKLATDEGTDVELTSVQLLDMDDKVILEKPLKVINKTEQFYETTELIDPPAYLFRIAIKGIDHKSNTNITRISLTPVKPQEVPREILRKSPVVTCVSKQIAAFDKSVQIRCKVSGYPQPKVEWESDDKSAVFTHEVAVVYLPNEYLSILDIKNVRKNSTYTLTASNSEGKDLAHILVETKMPYYYRPVAVPKDMVIDYQKSAQIPCKVDAYPPVTVSWYKGGRILKPDGNLELSADGTVLNILSMQPDLQDNYICEARSSLGRRVFRFRVDISGVEKPEIKKDISIINAIKSTVVDIQCPIVKGIPTPDIIWQFKQAGSYTFNTMPRTGDTLHFDNVDVSNAGSYKCKAENIIGEDYHGIDLNVEYEPSIPEHYQPTMTVDQGETVTMRCPAVGIPLPDFTWLHDGHDLRYSERHVIYYDGTLRFTAELSDFGEYECVARNPHGAGRISIQLKVNAAPVIESPTKSSIETKEGSQLYLSCSVRGSPKPMIKWLYRSNGAEKKTYPPSDRTGRLRLKSLRLEQSGEYTCVAANSRGSANITYTVSVVAPPTIHYTSNEFEAVDGDTQLRIPCEASGNPKPEITWNFQGVQLASGSRWYSINEDGSLIIKNVNLDSEGIYTCRASNKYGNTIENFNVIVYDSPDPGFLSNEVKLKKGESATIPCGVRHKKTDKLHWFKDGVFVSSSTLVLRDVTEADSGTYICHVSPVDGPANSASTRVEVGDAPIFLYVDDVKDIVYVEGDQAFMDCTARGVPEPEIKWYHDGEEISFNEFKYEFEMNSDAVKGQYTCVVSNFYGTVRQEFHIFESECVIDLTDNLNGYQPMILTNDNKRTDYETTDGIMRIPKGEQVKFMCPSRSENYPYNEIALACDNNQQFINPWGRSYSYSDLKCEEKWKPTVQSTGRRCLKRNSNMLKLGFIINDEIQDVYEVCIDMATKNPVYTKLSMQGPLAKAVHNDTEWYISGPSIDLERFYECSNQNAQITRMLNKDFHSGDACCFAKRMLVNPLDVAPGLPQVATYARLNVVPHWGTCNSKNWDEVERRIRNVVTTSKLQVFTGTAEDLTLPDSRFFQKNVVLSNGRTDVQVPRYLWKVVQDQATDSSLAIIQVNVPDLSISEASRYRLCKDVCNKVEWMKNGYDHWRNVINGYTYCCSLEDFERAFRYEGTFPNHPNLLLRVSALNDHL